MSRQEFEQWLREHRDRLKNYEAWEIARLAMNCGFEMDDMAADLSQWITVSRRKLLLWSNPLMLQWVELWGHERGNDWDTK